MNDAKKDLEKVIYLNNTNKRAKAGLGEIFLHQGDLEDGLNMMHDFYGFIRFSKNSDIEVKNALETLKDILDPVDFEQVKRTVGSAVIDIRQNESETRYTNDLSYLGIDMKLDVDQADYEDIPF